MKEAPLAPREEIADRSEAVGFYSDGTLLNPVGLPEESASHLKLFRLRNRGWGTKKLIDTIISAASAFHADFPFGDRVQIGDIAAENGGPLALHASHQNGLDADIAYLRVNHIERDPNGWGDRGFEEVFVKNGKLTGNFDLKRNWFLLKAVVAQGDISRIFVDPQIKRALCNHNSTLDPSENLKIRIAVLRRLRPYPEHDDHFHIRIKCPSTSPKCVAQEEPPVGSGCSNIEGVSFDEHEL